jgi:hypothetical protein
MKAGRPYAAPAIRGGGSALSTRTQSEPPNSVVRAARNCRVYEGDTNDVSIPESAGEVTPLLAVILQSCVRS